MPKRQTRKERIKYGECIDGYVYYSILDLSESELTQQWFRAPVNTCKCNEAYCGCFDPWDSNFPWEPCGSPPPLKPKPKPEKPERQWFVASVQDKEPWLEGIEEDQYELNVECWARSKEEFVEMLKPLIHAYVNNRRKNIFDMPCWELYAECRTARSNLRYPHEEELTTLEIMGFSDKDRTEQTVWDYHALIWTPAMDPSLK